MILYRKSRPLRIRHFAVPSAPFGCASSIAPYSPRRSTPVAIDYQTLQASGVERLDVTVCEEVTDALERARELRPPVLIDSSGAAEAIFRKGDEAARWCAANGIPAVQLVSSDGALPAAMGNGNVLALTAWPLDLERVERLAREASSAAAVWGLFVPILYPVTTDLSALDRLSAIAAANGATFLAGASIEGDATARQALARVFDLEATDDRYAVLFHGDPSPVQLATERHLAALAHEAGLADALAPPPAEERSNWNGAALLALVASRMIAMELDLDLASAIARSARTVAELDKPLQRVAEAASLSIIGGLDEASVEMLTGWLENGEAPFADYVNEQWRLRRN